MFARPSRIIVPQYEPPAGFSLLAAAELLGESRRAIAAQVVDFAVRRIVTVARPEGAGRGAGFTLTYTNPGPIAPPSTLAGADEHDLLRVLFPDGVASRRVIKPKRNRSLGQLLKEPHRRVVGRLIAAGLVRERGWLEKAVAFWRKQPTEPTAAVDRTVDHLWGLHDYIRLAERDRLAMLQSPDGALRDQSRDGVEVLRLFERLLPYAVLFGLEKEWMRELDLRARDLPPNALAALDGVTDVVEVVAVTAQAVELLVDIAQIVEASDALEGAGAFLGGLGEVLSNIDLPDLPDF